MKAKLLLCLALIFSIHLFASEVAANRQPQALASIWKFINYPRSNAPEFLISSGKQWNQVSRGLRLDIMSIQQGFWFLKTNAITARLYRANGEIVEPTAEGKGLLNAPTSISSAAVLPDGGYAPQVMTYFPWGPNALKEAWIAVTIGPERYWLEIPYGFDRNPGDPLPPAAPGGPPTFARSMQSLAEHDHLVQWQNVDYDLGQLENGRYLSLKQSNPFDANSEVVLYKDPGQGSWQSWSLFSPRTVVRLLDTGGTEVNGRCVNLHLGNDGLRRTDTFYIVDRGAKNTRCWGRIEISVDDQTNQVTVPSSLYKYTHGHALTNTPAKL